MKKIAILDYSSGTLFIHNAPSSEVNIEEWLTSEGFNINDIYYMEVQHVYIDV